MSANNQIQAENVSSLSLREASEKAVSALEGLLDHGKNAPWQAWEKALNANTFLRQALVAAEVDRHDAPDDVEVIYLVWAFQGHGSWTDATKEQYEKAKHDDRMAVVSLDAYLSKEQRTRPQQQAVAQCCAGCGKTSTSDSMWALYCLDCVQKHGVGAMPWIELAHELCPEGIDDLCDECGGEDAKCPAGCTYRKARAMLSASPAAPAAAQGIDAEWLARREQAAFEAGKQAAQVAQPLTDGDLVEHLAATGNLPGADYGSFRMGYCFALEYHGIGKDRA